MGQFDYNRVILHAQHDGDTGYINASAIESGMKEDSAWERPSWHYIVTQARALPQHCREGMPAPVADLRACSPPARLRDPCSRARMHAWKSSADVRAALIVNLNISKPHCTCCRGVMFAPTQNPAGPSVRDGGGLLAHGVRGEPPRDCLADALL